MLRRLCIAAICLSAMAMGSQEPQRPDSQESPVGTTATLHVNAQLVLLDASVTNKKTGKVIPGLTPEDFVLSEDGAAQMISSLSQNQLPLSLLFLFDATDTVQPVLYPLAVGARRVLNQLREGDEVEVATFSTHVTVVQKFTRDHPNMVFALGDASSVHDADQATFIFEDVFEATELMQGAQVPNSRRVEVWLTDSSANMEDEAMRREHAKGAPAVLHTKAQAAEILGRSGAVVSVLVQESDLTRRQRSQSGFSRFGDVESFADSTGGPVLHSSQADAVDRFGSLLSSLRERYTLGYRPSQSKPAGTVCKLQLVLSPTFFGRHPELRAKDIAIRTRQSYVR